MTPEEKAKMYCERIHLPDEDFEYLSKLIREEEREACAKVLWNENSNHRRDCNTWYGHQPCDCPEYNYAQAIRERGEK
jgi:hypothetical protein